MATGTGTCGYGRGGRGAAILEALGKSRKPSQADGQVSVRPSLHSQVSSPVVGPLALSSSEPMVSIGRGRLLIQPRMAAQPMEPARAPESQLKVQFFGRGVRLVASDTPISKPMGRGLTAMKALIAQQQQQQQQRLCVPFDTSSVSREHPKLELAAATAAEDKQVTELKIESKHNGYERENRLPTITKIGTDGIPSNLTANYIRVHCKNSGVYMYHVEFSPSIDNKKLKMKLLAEHKDILKTVNSFDGMILYLPERLPDVQTVMTSKRYTDGTIITITLTFVKVVAPEQCCHLYNVVLRRIMYILKMCQVGRYYYNHHLPATVPQHKLEVWPGYITAIKEHEGGILLVCDASHKVLRTETVYDIMEQTVQENPQGFREEIVCKIVGCTVLTRYNNKTYRIDDIIWNKNPMDRFECKASGESMSFQEYYKKHHNLQIQNLTQPLLLHKRKPSKDAPPNFKPNPEFLCLIPELSYMTGLTDDMRSKFTVMKDLAVHTRVTPAQRQIAMKKFILSVNSSPEAQAELAIWGLELDTSTISISGRILPSEKIIMGNREFNSDQQADWSREVTRNVLINPVHLKNWGIYYTRKDASKANDFVRTLQAESRNMGISCNVPFRKELVNEKIDSLIQELRNSVNEKVQLVVVINPTNRDDRYSAIKKVCCVEISVPSQVIVAKTISRPDKLRSVVQKIALQINCKLGGELWAVRIPLQRLMVVGIDSYHDASKGKQSVGGFVASMNHYCTRWHSSVCFQKPGQELVHGLQICFSNALRKYYAENHFLPEKIVIFRDGVGDGQLGVLADSEIKQLQRCFSSFGQYAPQCAILCVQKRINTRIFDMGKNGQVVNPLPGTVVDHTITKRDRYDFFLVSQHVRQGTVTPTHYIVMDDSIDLKPGHMQRLTYKMTHLYYNWPGTIRVPAPCQYAHKLAYLVGQSIHKEPTEYLSDRLFFL